MSYKDLRDFEQEYEYTSDDGLIVQVEKMGGGTLGRKYVGTWRYIVTNGMNTEVARGQDYESNVPLSHSTVARDIARYYRAED